MSRRGARPLPGTLRLGGAFLVLYAACSFLWVNHLIADRRGRNSDILYGDEVRVDLKAKLSQASDPTEAASLRRRIDESQAETDAAYRGYPKVGKWEEGLETVGGIALALYVGAAILGVGRQGRRDPVR